MPVLLSAARGASVALLAFLATACIVRSERSDHGGDVSPGTVGPGGGTGSGTSGGSDGPAGSAASPTPILVQVDTGKTMSADPGNGVGIFTEYSAGGHWHVWWTCDTNQTNQSCTFDLRVSGAAINNIAYEKPLPSDTAQSGPTQIDIHAVTSTAVAGVTFDTEAGATIQLEAQVDAVADPSFFFFVQDGKVNGGYAGKLTNPLLFQGKNP